MVATNITFSGFSARLLKQEHKESRYRSMLLLAVVVTLHSAIAFELLIASKNTIKKQPMMIEVAMVTLPKPVIRETSPVPVVKPVENKKVIYPIVKPEPVKKIKQPKPILQPRILTTTAQTAETSIPKFETAPVVTPVLPAQTVAKTVSKPTETDPTNFESSAASGGTCENCESIELKLQRKYARRNFSGSISFLFTINEDGTVRDATFKKCEPDDTFDDDVISSVKETLMEMEFNPRIVNGKAVIFKGTKTIRFKITK